VAQTAVQKFEQWASEVEGKVQALVVDAVGSDAAAKAEAYVKSLLSSDLGTLALQAVQDAKDVNTGQVNVATAITKLRQQAAAQGKTIASSLSTSLIGAAQLALESRTVPNAPAPPAATPPAAAPASN
jgi:hypothetical protein